MPKLLQLKPSILRFEQYIERYLPAFLCGNSRNFRNGYALLYAQGIQRFGQHLGRAAQQRDQQMPELRRGLGHSV